MLRGGVAEQQRLAFGAEQRRGNGVRRIVRLARQRRRDAFARGDRHGHVGQRLQPCRRCGSQARPQRHRPVVVRCMQAMDQRAPARRLAQSLREQRMVLAQEGADDEGRLQRRQRSDRSAQPARRTRRRGVAEVGMAQAEVDVLAAQAAHQLGQQVQFFERAVRRGQRADAGGAELGLDALQAVGHIAERGVPVHRLPRAALADHGRGQPRSAVQRLVAETVAVGNPALVDLFVLQREHAHDLVGLGLHDQVGAGGIVRADALAPRQLPGARAVAEGLAGQRADRADVDHVARQLGIDGAALDRRDLGMFAAVDHAEFHHPGDLLAEAHAARAVDAAAHLLHADQRADVLVEDDALFFGVARSRAAVAHCQILQLALAALVADRAVQRMVDQQELHHRLLRGQRLRALGVHHHALRHRRGTGRHRLGRLLDVDQAHAAVGRDAELLVIAEMRHVDAGGVGGMHHHAAGRDADRLAVELEFDHEWLTAAPTTQRLCST